MNAFTVLSGGGRKLWHVCSCFTLASCICHLLQGFSPKNVIVFLLDKLEQ